MVLLLSKIIGGIIPFVPVVLSRSAFLRCSNDDAKLVLLDIEFELTTEVETEANEVPGLN